LYRSEYHKFDCRKVDNVSINLFSLVNDPQHLE